MLDFDPNALAITFERRIRGKWIGGCRGSTQQE
jgi:hypothetical protein